MRLCEQYENMISAFIDGVLSEEDRRVLMDHMAGCPGCQAYFDQQIAIHDALMDDAAQSAVEAPEGFAAEVMARVQFTPQEKKKSRRKAAVRWRQWAALAACCAVAAAGFWTVRTPPADRVPLKMDQTNGAAASGGDTTAAMPEAVRCMPETSAGAVDDTADEPEAEEAPAVAGGTALSDAPPPEEAEPGAPSPTTGERTEEEGLEKASLQDHASEAQTTDTAQDAGEANGLPGAFAMPAPAAGLQTEKEPVESALEEKGEFDGYAGSYSGAYRCVMTAAGPAVRTWVEEQGLPWTEGGLYELSAGEYAQLRETLTEAGEDFTEQASDAENSEGFLLIAEESSETG